MYRRSVVLTIDIGTGSVRSALVDGEGTISAFASESHATFTPRHGWVEQQPQDWWTGAIRAIRATLGKSDGSDLIEAVVCCGQMHAPVLIDRTGKLVRERVQLWNDKRAATEAHILECRRINGALPLAINPATTAWPGVKLNWIAENDPDAIDKSWHVLMPKDYLNFCLTGEVFMDWTEAGSSFMADPSRQSWSATAMSELRLPMRLLPSLVVATEKIGRVSTDAAQKTGLPSGTPVFAGAGDFPAAIVGSGVTQPNQISDITGTSFLLTRPVAHPIIHSKVMNIALANGGWGAFAVVDAAGDAIRWASRTLDRGRRSYSQITSEAAQISPGANGLVFLPYLTGERLGQGPDSKAAFLGLSAAHQTGHLYRAIMEGVVMAMHEAFAPIQSTTLQADAIVSAAGGAKSDLWLQIKANIFDLPVIATEQAEAGLIGSAALAFTGLGRFKSPAEAAQNLVRLRSPIMPDKSHRQKYQDLVQGYAAIRQHMQVINKSLESYT